MSKLLELVGLGLIGGTIYAFLGLIAQKDPLGWPLFWAFAGGVLAIIVYRKHKRDQAGSKDRS